MSEMTTKTQAHPWFVWESEYAEGCTIIAATSAEAAQEEYRRMSGADPETPLDAKPVTAEDVVRLETQWEQAKEEIGRLRAQVDIAKAELADVLVEADVERTKAETREQKLEDRIAALEAQLTTRGACECGADDVCALARRAQEAERERDEAQKKAAALTEGLRLVSDALARLDNIYRADIDLLGDPPVETPAWLQEAQHRAAALLAPTTPATEQSGEGERCPHACIDEHEQPTNDPCPFSKPCPVHDAMEVRRG